MPIIQHLTEGKRNGFFIEAGGLDGELHANSVFFELERNWTGKILYSRKLRYVWSFIITIHIPVE